MNWDEIQRDWTHLKGRVKQRWSKLGEEQLTAIGGRRAALAARIKETYHLTREETEAQLDDWQASLEARTARE